MVTPPVALLAVETWTQLPLPRLFDDTDSEAPDRWSFAVVTVEAAGRVTVPAVCRGVFPDGALLRASTHGEAVVLRNAGAGRRVRIDRRGRMGVPCGLREATAPSRALLVAACLADPTGAVVILSPPRLLTGWADGLVGERS